MGKIKLPLPAVEVVPHKGSMALLRHVIAHNVRETLCDVRIGANNPFFEAGRVASWIGLEYMAQAVAAHAGMVARRAGKPPAIGFLLGTRKADFYTAAFRLGQTLHVAARHVWGDGDLFSFDCSIADAQTRKRLAEAQLNIFRPDDVSRYLRGENA
jgi:predicted hotdog family 3-hydroxylacyl-ACP dehydratase